MNKSTEFFALPTEVKDKYVKHGNYYGYYRPGDKLTTYTHHIHEVREMWDVPGIVGSWKAPKYPEEVPELQPAMEDLTEECRALLKKVLLGMAKALKLQDESYMEKVHQSMNDDKVESKSTIRCLYYPPLPENVELPPNAIRCRSHTDFGTITM